MGNIAVSADLKRHYADCYRDGESEWRRLGAIDKAANIVALCADLPHGSVLEVGAGEGSVLNRLSDLGFGDRLYGLEISSTGINAIQGRQIPRLAECKLFDGYSIPYAAQAFDLAILSHVVEHLEHPRMLLYEAARVARYVFVEVPLEDTMRMRTDYVFDQTGHINAYSVKTIRRLLQTCNLEILKQMMTTPSQAVHVFQRGTRGLISYWIKAASLKAWPGWASRLFTYHSSVLCRSKG